MDIKERRQAIGAVTALVPRGRDSFFTRLVEMLNSVSEAVHVVAGNAVPDDFGNAYVYPVEHKSSTSVPGRIAGQVALQIKISWKLIGVAKSADVWIFFMGEVLLLPILVLKLSGRKIFLALAGSLEMETLLQRKFLGIPHVLMKWINLMLCDKIILYSPVLVQAWKLQRCRHKILIASRHYVDLGRFKSRKNLDERENIVGYIGPFQEEKGILEFINAIPSVLQKTADTRFMIVGGGRLDRRVKELLSEKKLNDKVRFNGWVAHDEIPTYLNELKLLVLPSYSEGLPNIVLEAMACGTPVLASPVGSVPDLIVDGETGFIMEDNSPQCIANNVERALKHTDLGKVANTARELIEKDFTFEAAVERYQKILEEV